MRQKLLITLFAVSIAAAASAQDVMKKESDGTFVVNTTSLAKDVKGFKGATPLEVYIKKNKIVKVVPLRTVDGPKYVEMVKTGMLVKYEGMKVSDVEKTQIDGVTGATFTSEAMRENVKRAIEYFKNNK